MTNGIWLALGIFIFAAYTLQATTGFGGAVNALALGALLLPFETLIPILVSISLCMDIVMVWRHPGHIDFHLLLRVVLPGMLTGTLMGYFVRPMLDAAMLRQMFGLLMIWFAGRELWRMRRASAMPARPVWLTTLITGCAGVTHGLFASGGPLLVYALSGLTLGKANFRVTLNTVWLVLDGVLVGAFWMDGRLHAALPIVAGYIPVIAVAVILGEWLHHRVSEQRFRVGIYVLLMVTGGLLARPNY